MNDEGARQDASGTTSYHPPQTIAAPRVVLALARSLEAERTVLQRNFVRFFAVVADVRELDERNRATFADVAGRALVNAFGPDLVVAEAEDLTRRAA